MTTPAAVLDFWFADALATPEASRARSAVWFGQDDAFDRRIAERFGTLPEAAARGELDGWQREPESCLALVLVLDQFPRNLHRGSARAFAYDAHALRVASGALERGVDRALHPVQASFLYLPFEHAEDLSAQRRCVELYEGLLARTAADLRPRLEDGLRYARLHLEIIERFGRFPHRNDVLGRASTAEETAYLAGGGHRFGQGGSRGTG